MAADSSGIDGKSGEVRMCSECPKLFVAKRKDQVCCSASCRMRKTRRLKAGGPPISTPEEAAKRVEQARVAVEDGAIAIAGELLREELRPVVRENLSADVLSAISDLVALTPLIVAGLKEEMVGAPLRDPLTGELLRDPQGRHIHAVDPDRRLKAIQLAARYTIGSPGLAPQPEINKAPIAINFGSVPRPDWDATAERECDVCNLMRLESEFVGESSRCTHCQSEIEARVQELVDPAEPE